MENPFPYSDSNKRYHTYAYYLKKRFGGKVSRISLNGGFTCPNIDGTVGTGGCIYCSPAGSGEFAGDPAIPIREQFAQGAALMGQKWDTQMHIAYFQARTNTYAPVPVLRRLYEEALSCPGVVGLSIATRPDCLPDETCDLLAELSRRTYLTVELGLQTIHDKTGRLINRCHTYEQFLEGYRKLRQRGILVGAHLINGLPGETPEMMAESVKALAQLDLHLMKLHLLYITEGTPLAALWRAGKVRSLEPEEYTRIVCDQIELIPSRIVLGRITGDGAPDTLLAPQWSRKKLCVLNSVDQELARRGSYQGFRYTEAFKQA